LIAGPSGPAPWRHMKYNVTLKVTFEVHSEEGNIDSEALTVKKLVEEFPPIQACGSVEIDSISPAELLN